MHKPPIFNAARALDQAAFAHPTRPSLTYGETVLSVADAALMSRKLAQLLAQAGVARGDRVMIASHNSPYHLVAYIACARLGAVFVPVSFRLTQVELQQLVDFCGPRAIICEPEIDLASGWNNKLRVSIHAPAWGATPPPVSPQREGLREGFARTSLPHHPQRTTT